MKLNIVAVLLTFVIVTESYHTFIGTNIFRPILYHHNVQYPRMVFRKRVENLYYTMPAQAMISGRTIQGILAFDLTFSEASVNITQGGIGFNFVNLRMKSDRGKQIHYDVYIFA